VGSTVLGISAFYHDSAAAVVRDGEIVAAAAEEAFSRTKHDRSFPAAAIDYCLRAADTTLADLDHISYYELPSFKAERVASAMVAAWAGHTTAARRRRWPRLRQPQQCLPKLRGRKLLAVEHHLSHAASAFYPSPFPHAAILTVDGVGEFKTATISRGVDTGIRVLRSIDYPNSLGLLYSAFTYYCGFKVNSGEYKLMGLSAYGSPRFQRAIEDNLVKIGHDGAVRINQRYFNFLAPDDLIIRPDLFTELFGHGRWAGDQARFEFYADVAASVQAVFEKAVLAMAAHAKEITKDPNLCLAGGGALNCVANSRLRDSGLFDRVWVQPAASDAGGSVGSALYVSHARCGVRRAAGAGDGMRGSYLGPGYSDDQVEQALKAAGATYQKHTREELVRLASEALAQGKILGWFQGRLEFGPRALGNRSILADPRRPEMQDLLNSKVKLRESFRPFAPAVLRERSEELFENSGDSPYMLFISRVRDSRLDLPAVTHVDGTARVQTVDQETNPLFHSLLSRFEERTGCPVLVNTSFNVRGEPIVCTPLEAVRCFSRSNLDVLAIGPFWLRQSEQTALSVDVEYDLGED
jgi:carbamoyltransferase